MLSASANASSTPVPAFPAASYCAALLVLVWLVAMAQLLWHFEKQRLAHSQQLMHFEAHTLPSAPLAASQGIAKVIYFVDVQCRCSVAALSEIRRLQRNMTTSLAQFIYASTAISGIEAQPLSAAERIRWRDFVPATPAVAVWDARDQLIYFGPVNVASLCTGGVESKSYLQIALLSLQQIIQKPQQAIDKRMQQIRDIAFKSWDVVACACPAAAQL